MKSVTRQVPALSRAMVLAVALTAAATQIAVAQTTDSTQPPRARVGPGRALGEGRGMRARIPMRRNFAQPGAPGMRAPAMRVGERGPGPRALLRGITLSVEQEKSLRASQARKLLEAKPLRLEMLSAGTDQQLARLNGDQKALDVATARLTAARSRLDSLRSKRSPVEELRSVLTPDQQKILDKNLADAPQGGRAFGPGRGMGRGMGGGLGTPGGMRFRDGAAPRGFRNAPQPRRPTGEEGEGEATMDRADIPAR
ncbi:MAG: hypothetical protein IT359_19120 [Gemmatimonadaceae bacterium]|nr:hypothetical protein [Gemmatimonadaceae bacterium]